MKSGLKKRLAIVGIAITPPKKRLIIMKTIAPYNYWDVKGLQARASGQKAFTIEREGDRLDVTTLQALEDQAKARAKALEAQNGFNCLSMRFIMDDETKSCTQYSFNGTIPDNLQNTHLNSLYQY